MKLRKIRGSWKGICLLLMMTLIIVGCASSEPEEINEVETDEMEQVYNPEDSPPLRIAITRPTQLNPLLNGNETLFQVYHLVYESLITFNESFDIDTLLAESWEMDPQGLSVTFNLREDVTWHDGEPFRAEDVIFTYHVLREQAERLEYPNLYTNNLRQISDVRITGDHAVRFTFTRPYSNILETLTFPILPQHIFEGENRSLLTSDEFPMIGTGRYQVQSYDVSHSMILKDYPAYWGKRPYIQKIEITIVPDRQAQLSLFENGAIDLVEPLSVDWAKYTDSEKIAGIEYPSTQYEFIAFNFQHDHWNDPRLRQAVAHVVDRDQILQSVYFGHGQMTEVPVSPSSWLYHQETIRFEHQTERARELISETDLPADTTFILLTNAGNPFREKTAEIIVEAMTEAGLLVDLEVLKWEDLQQRIAEGEFDMVLAGWQFSMIPDLSFAFHSSQEAAGNFIGYQNDRMDHLLESVFAAPNRSLKAEQWEELQDFILSELPYVSLFFKNHALLLSSSVKGDLDPIQFNHFRGIESAYLIPSRESTSMDTE